MVALVDFASCDEVDVCCFVLYFFGPVVSVELCALLPCELVLELPALVVCADAAPTMPANKTENAILFID